MTNPNIDSYCTQNKSFSGEIHSNNFLRNHKFYMYLIKTNIKFSEPLDKLI